MKEGSSLDQEAGQTQHQLLNKDLVESPASQIQDRSVLSSCQTRG